MKVLLSILIVIGVIFVGWKVWDYWEKTDQQKLGETVQEEAIVPATSLEGLPRELVKDLAEKQKRGAEGLRQFLDQWSHVVKDPRLASIELDYVVAISAQDPVEAKKLYAKVKKRIPPESPLYPRIKALAVTYD